MVRARVAGGLLALIVALLPVAPAGADAVRSAGVHPDVVRALMDGTASIAVGGRHSCVISSAGRAYCWGSDSDGQLGDGGGPVDAAAAVAVRGTAGVRVAVQVAAGDEHTCVLTADGLASCWGDNSSGQLGVGAGADEHAPVRVESLAGRRLVRIATGADHSCAVDAGGAAWCWGDNASGQLGRGGAPDAAVPVRVSAATGLTDPVVDIAAGHDTTCAATAAGVAWCWGAGADGQLGYGGTGDRGEPVRVSTAGALDGVRVRRVTVGHKRACALDDRGGAACWGGGARTPAGSGGPGLTRISAGGTHVCGTDRAGELWCRGAGATPVRIAARDVAVGERRACALDRRGAVTCWAAGDTAPVRVSGLPGAPPAVTGLRVTPFPGGLHVTWRPVAGFRAGWSYVAATSDLTATCVVTAATGCDLTGLVNGRDYEVAVLTAAGVGHALSDRVTAAPGRASGDAAVLAPGAGGGLVPITGTAPLVLLTVGLLLIGLGLSALSVRRTDDL